MPTYGEVMSTLDKLIREKAGLTGGKVTTAPNGKLDDDEDEEETETEEEDEEEEDDEDE